MQTRIQNVDDETVNARASAQLRKSFKSSGHAKLKTYIAPQNGTDIPDNDELKLIVLRERNDAFCRNLMENRGGNPAYLS